MIPIYLPLTSLREEVGGGGGLTVSYGPGKDASHINPFTAMMSLENNQ